MSLDHHPAYSPDQEAEDLASLRLRSRTSTSTTTASASTSSHSRPDQLLPSLAPTPFPALPATARPKNHRGAGRKPNRQSTRRSSVNQKRDKKKADSHSPPILKNDPDPPLDDDANITRCVCDEDNDEANDVIMFQCDKCSVWQHGPCVGLYAEFPGDYFCEKCRPDLHTTGQYQKSSPHQPSRRSPSFTSSTTRRDRVNPDAASLAAFLTDAGVKPEDQISLGGFALPTFAQTRRQSNMLVDGAVPHTHKKQSVLESSPGLSASGVNEAALLDPPKPKRKRLSLDQIHSPTSASVDIGLDEKLKRPRISPAAEMLSPAPSVSTTASRQHNPPSVTSQSAGPPTKQKRPRKLDDTDDSAGPSVRAKAAGVFGNHKSGGAGSTSGAGRRGSPSKRGHKEDGRRTKNQGSSHPGQQEAGTKVSVSEGWGLPDHLSYLEYLLPGAGPGPVTIEAVGPGQPRTVEPATKVKFPSKRTTIADLRKRSKHLVDYLQKVQIECCDREKRAELIRQSARSKPGLLQPLPAHPPFLHAAHSVVSPKTLEIIDDLSRQLYHWQEKFKQN